jgi:hypothetical protein
MKGLSFVFYLIVFTTKIFSQENTFPIDSITGKITYSEIIKVDSVNNQKLYLRANVWFVHSFVSAKNVIQLNDKESGKIIGKGTFQVTDNNNHNSLVYVPIVGTVDFTVEIQTKDERYKYVLSDFSYKINGETEIDLTSSSGFKSGMFQKRLDIQWADIKQNTNMTILNMIESLKNSMGTKYDSDKW